MNTKTINNAEMEVLVEDFVDQNLQEIANILEIPVDEIDTFNGTVTLEQGYKVFELSIRNGLIFNGYDIDSKAEEFIDKWATRFAKEAAIGGVQTVEDVIGDEFVQALEEAGYKIDF